MNRVHVRKNNFSNEKFRHNLKSIDPSSATRDAVNWLPILWSNGGVSRSYLSMLTAQARISVQSNTPETRPPFIAKFSPHEEVLDVPMPRFPHINIGLSQDSYQYYDSLAQACQYPPACQGCSSTMYGSEHGMYLHSHLGNQGKLTLNSFSHMVHLFVPRLHSPAITGLNSLSIWAQAFL